LHSFLYSLKNAFRADWTFLEAPLNEKEMEMYCREVN
jgi:hypothetical protein